MLGLVISDFFSQTTLRFLGRSLHFSACCFNYNKEAGTILNSTWPSPVLLQLSETNLLQMTRG
jgi:hypothetical protein